MQDDLCEIIPGLKCCEPVITKMHPTDFLRLILAEFAPLACRVSVWLAGMLACRNECGYSMQQLPWKQFTPEAMQPKFDHQRLADKLV